VSLSPAGLAELQREHNGCLCLPCLQALAAMERDGSGTLERPT
jgi:hypothetical protein